MITLAIVMDTKTTTFGDRTLMTGTYTAADVGILGLLNLTDLGFVEVNAVMHMGDSKTNISLRSGSSAVDHCIPNVITVVNSNPASVTMNIWNPVAAPPTANGGGKFMIIGRRGSA